MLKNKKCASLPRSKRIMVIQRYITLNYMKEFIEVFPSFMNCFYRVDEVCEKVLFICFPFISISFLKVTTA